MIIQRGIKKISKKKILIKREDWLEEAFGCEKGCSLETAKAIIRSIMQLDMPDKDFEKQWLEDSENAIQREYTVCAKAILEFALQNCSEVKEIWYKAISFERMHGTAEGLEELQTAAVKIHQDSAEFWMRLAKSFILKNEIENARSILQEAQKTCTNQDAIYLARVHQEKECNDYTEAKRIIQDARETINTESCWIESIQLERQFGKNNEALKISKQSIKNKPECLSLYLVLENIYEELNFVNEARQVQEMGKSTKNGKKDKDQWIRLILLEEKVSGVNKVIFSSIKKNRQGQFMRLRNQR